MNKKQFGSILFFLTLVAFFLYIEAENDPKNFVSQVNALKKEGMTMKQIYGRLKLKKESFNNFLLRLQAEVLKTAKKNTSNYPYQRPQNFNPELIKEDYYFLGDIMVYGDPKDEWELKDTTGAIIRKIQTNKLISLSPLLGKTNKADSIYQDMQRFKLNEGKSASFSLISSNRNIENLQIIWENNDKFLTLYLGNPTVKKHIEIKDFTGNDEEEVVDRPAKGFKIIFDKDKFRIYLTQTFFYKLMLNNFKDPVVGFGLGFSVAPTQIALIDVKDPRKIMNLFNIKLIFKVNKKTAQASNSVDSYYDSERLDIQEKIQEHNYTELIKYADLFAVGALHIQPLTIDDARKIDQSKST